MNVKPNYSKYDSREYITPINTMAAQILHQKRNTRNTSNSLRTRTSIYKLSRNLELHTFEGPSCSTVKAIEIIIIIIIIIIIYYIGTQKIDYRNSLFVIHPRTTNKLTFWSHTYATTVDQWRHGTP